MYLCNPNVSQKSVLGPEVEIKVCEDSVERVHLSTVLPDGQALADSVRWFRGVMQELPALSYTKQLLSHSLWQREA